MSVEGLAEFTDELDSIGEHYFDPSIVFRQLDAKVAGPVTGRLDVWAGGGLRSTWSLTADGVAETLIRLGLHYAIRHAREHPLLLDHVEPSCELFIRGPAASPDQVAGQLLAAHERRVGSWRPIMPYINRGLTSDGSLISALTARHGQLAIGPRPLLRDYEDVLDAHSLSAGLLDQGPAKRWDEERQWVIEDRDLSVLLLQAGHIGSHTKAPAHSYIIASDFVLSRRDEANPLAEN